MMRSLYSGVAGLKTHQTKMDVIGNNIANVNTTSFKSQSITFSDLMYQTTQTASGATETKGGVNARQIGLGAKSGAINTAITSQGATQTTNNPFDIMITGNSFFIVNNGTEDLYTRDGSFYVDGAGNLAMQSNGYLVQGWVAQEDKVTGEITVNKNGGLSSLQIMSAENSTYSPASTTAALFSGNIDDNDTNVVSDEGKTITLEFYDNKGYLYTGKFTLKDTADPHFFALTLTDIIDSSGNSFKDAGLLEGVTFGNQTSTSKTSKLGYDKAEYTFVTGSVDNTVTINSTSGVVKYENVAKSGSVSSLLSNYSALLEEAYGTNAETIELLYLQDSKDATYSIANNGDLTITYAENVVKDSDGKPVAYDLTNYNADFSSKNTSKYFVNSIAQTAYLALGDNTSGDVDETGLTKEMLMDVFGMNATDAAKYVAGGYNYVYANNDGLTIYKDLTMGTSASGTGADLNTKYKPDLAYLKDGNGEFLSDQLAAFAAATNADLSTINFSFDGKKLTINQTQPKESDTLTVANADTKIQNISGYNTYLNDVAGAEYTLAQLQDAIDGCDTSTTEGQNKKTALTALQTLITNEMNDIADATFPKTATTFKLTGLTGTPALSINYSIDNTNFVKWETYGKTSYSRNPEVNKKLTDGNGYTLPSTPPEYVYKNAKATYGQNYYTTAKSFTVASGDSNIDDLKSFLKTVYNGYADEIESAFGSISNNGPYTVTIDDKGYLTIARSITSSAYTSSLKVSPTEEGINYTSGVAYADVPVKGNMKDLMEAASSDLAGLLKTIYGTDDATADAYGTDGTYEIITTEGTDYGKINISVGDKTVQLKFNAANGSLDYVDVGGASKATINFNQNFNLPLGDGGLEAFGFQTLTGNEDLNAGDMVIDFSTVTNYNTNGSSTIKAVKGDKKSLNTGRAVGEMNGVSVSTDGQIYATYSNGQTKLLGQIASAQFANASGLSKEGDNLYTSTLNSGDPTVQDITTDGGYMNTGVLEMSNVDLSSQFTEMITTQRGFQANSRIITVSDTLLEELTNLKR